MFLNDKIKIIQIPRIMKLNKLKTIKCIRSKVLAFAMASWFITLLVLLIENGGLRELIFFPIGAIILTLIYFKMNNYIKKLDTMP